MNEQTTTVVKKVVFWVIAAAVQARDCQMSASPRMQYINSIAVVARLS